MAILVIGNGFNSIRFSLFSQKLSPSLLFFQFARIYLNLLESRGLSRLQTAAATTTTNLLACGLSLAREAKVVFNKTLTTSIINANYLISLLLLLGWPERR